MLLPQSNSIASTRQEQYKDAWPHKPAMDAKFRPSSYFSPTKPDGLLNLEPVAIPGPPRETRLVPQKRASRCTVPLFRLFLQSYAAAREFHPGILTHGMLVSSCGLREL